MVDSGRYQLQHLTDRKTFAFVLGLTGEILGLGTMPTALLPPYACTAKTTPLSQDRDVNHLASMCYEKSWPGIGRAINAGRAKNSPNPNRFPTASAEKPWERGLPPASSATKFTASPSPLLQLTMTLSSGYSRGLTANGPRPAWTNGCDSSRGN